jgi:ribose-phosphate pyrophosphokinase
MNTTYEIHMPEDKGVKYDSFRYPGGEVQVRIRKDQFDEVKAADSLRVTARITSGEVMELGLLTTALNYLKGRPTFKYRTLFLPYLPYGRADRLFVIGDGFGLAAFTNLIDTMDYTNVWSLDVHSHVSKQQGILNIIPDTFIASSIEDMRTTGTGSIALLLPDKGAHRYALKQFGLPIYQADKVRDPATGKLTHFDVPSIAEDRVLIVDDICDGGGTFAGIAQTIIRADEGKYVADVVAQKHELNLYVTHGIFSKGLEPLKAFKRVYTTNSFPNNFDAFDGVIKFDIGGVF